MCARACVCRYYHTEGYQSGAWRRYVLLHMKWWLTDFVFGLAGWELALIFWSPAVLFKSVFLWNVQRGKEDCVDDRYLKTELKQYPPGKGYISLTIWGATGVFPNFVMSRNPLQPHAFLHWIVSALRSLTLSPNPVAIGSTNFIVPSSRKSFILPSWTPLKGLIRKRQIRVTRIKRLLVIQVGALASNISLLL